MVFTSIEFLSFFLIFISIYFLVPLKFRWAYILSGSLVFYYFSNPFYLIYLIFPTILVYLFALNIERIRSIKWKKLNLVLAVLSPLLLLVFFKYTNFLYSTFMLIIARSKGYDPLHIILPLGISFFTFKLISYSVDVYREKIPAEKHIGYLAAYVSFFPQLLMGPIERAGNLIPELKKRVSFDFDRIMSGVMLVSWGLFKKMVISDRLAIFVDKIFASPSHQGVNLILAIWFYSFQIYCDFSGYSDIAIGLTRIMGFRSMKNFDFPYFSRNMTQFWNKWHISLSTWLRDYLFLPIAYRTMRNLEGEKKYGIKVEYLGYAAGMFITMFLGGLWHGAAWTFVIWGILHGIYLIVGYTTRKRRRKLRKKSIIGRNKHVSDLVSMFLTFNLVSFAWIFFRSETITDAYEYIHSMSLGFAKVSVHQAFYIPLLILFIFLEYLYKNRERIQFIHNSPQWMRMVIYVLFICFIFLFSVDSSNEFIYMRF